LKNEIPKDIHGINKSSLGMIIEGKIDLESILREASFHYKLKTLLETLTLVHY
jgi:hypothetical protein